VLDSRGHPEQANRSCLGILGLGKRFTPERLEAACRRALKAGIYSYKGVRNILDNQLDKVELELTILPPLPPHVHIRGDSYYN
jgi:hypothetical protein